MRQSPSRTIAVAATSLLLAACASWTRPNTTPAQADQDKSTCYQQALQDWPEQMTAPPAASRNFPRCTPLSNQANCIEAPPAAARTPPRDASRKPRQAAYESCLSARGYRRAAG
jgi:hypothetical protein